MTYSTLLRIKNDAILVEYLIAATELIASSEKGYKEFRDGRGRVFRATDYDPHLKQRVEVPIRGNKATNIRQSQPQQPTEKIREGAKDTLSKVGDKSKQVGEDAKAIGSFAKSSFALSAEVVTQALQNPDFRKRVGLAAGMPAAKLILACLEKLKFSEASEKVDEWIAKGTEELAVQYGDDKDPFAQAIRKGDGLAPDKDAALKDKLEFYAAKHAIYMDVLKNPEKHNATKESVAKAVAAFVPVAVTMGLTLGFGVGIPLLAGEGVASVLTSFAMGEAIDLATQKGLDELKVENMWVRMGVGILAGVASGGIVTLAAKNPSLSIASMESSETLDDTIKFFKEWEDVILHKKGNKTPGSLPDNVSRKTRKDGSDKWLVYHTKVDYDMKGVSKGADVKLNVLDKSILGRAFQEVEFTINDSLNEAIELPKRARISAAFKLKSIFESHIASMPNGTMLACVAWSEDSPAMAAARQKAYISMGFGSPDKNGVMLGVIKGGSVVPVNAPSFVVTILDKLLHPI